MITYLTLITKNRKRKTVATIDWKATYSYITGVTQCIYAINRNKVYQKWTRSFSKALYFFKFHPIQFHPIILAWF